MSLPLPDMPTVDAVPWETAVDRMDWWPGEHVTLIGPTGRGKTELMIQLMAERTWKVFLSTKKRDSTQRRLERQQFRVIKDAAELNPDVDYRYLFRPAFPRGKDAGDLRRAHGHAFGQLLIRLRDQMGWTVCVDECQYMVNFLKLEDELNLLWMQGRSEGTTMITNTQRPRHIPLAAYSQATHLFFWSSPDLQDVNRLGEMVPIPTTRIRAILAGQGHHEVLYCNTVSGDMFQTNTRW